MDLDLYAFVSEKDRIVVLNKIDIADQEQVENLRGFFPDDSVLGISARHHQGLSDLQNTISIKIMGVRSLRERDSCAPNVRHQAALKETLASCGRLREALAAGVTPDLIAVEVQSALDYLGDIVGLTTPDDVLDTIFSDFCIGK